MAQGVEILQPAGLAAPIGSYSHAARVAAGHFLFVAGQVALDEHGNLVGENDFAAQARQVFRNVERALRAVGQDFSSVVKFTTFLVFSNDIPAFYAVRKELFPELFPRGGYPPNTLLVVDRLVRSEFLVEIEAIAAWAVE